MSSKNAIASEMAKDGRVVRGERNRQALMDATWGLIIDGNLAPSAQEIAERSGVALRGIYRHFGGMEGLRAAIDDQKFAHNSQKFISGSREGSFTERLLRAIETRAEGFEYNRNVFLSAQISMWNSEVLQKNYKRDVLRLRKDLEVWLPELKSLSTYRREAVNSAASFEVWYRLREHQNHSVEASIDIVYDMIKVLMTVP